MPEGILRFLIIMAPALLALGVHVTRERSSLHRSAALFGGLWCFLAALIVSICAVHSNAWFFRVKGVALYGVPVDIMLGLGLCAGAAVLAMQKPRFWPLWGIMLAACAAAAVAGQVKISLYNTVAAAQAVLALLLAAVVPALLLAVWTAQRRHVYARTLLQSVIWCVLLLWLLPSVALLKTGSSWNILFSQNPLRLMPMLLPAAMIANALYVFAKHGDGTGFPYDPPQRLVTQGIYAYISNPTQLAICLAMGWWGVVLHSWVVFACAPMAVFLFVVFKDVCNGSSNLCGADPAWAEYHARVPRWIPKIKKKK